jgi:hypothetical protein
MTHGQECLDLLDTFSGHLILPGTIQPKSAG